MFSLSMSLSMGFSVLYPSGMAFRTRIPTERREDCIVFGSDGDRTG